MANEQEVRDVYETALGETFEKSLRLVAPTIRICTSNTSDSGANIYPCLKCVDENGAFYSILAGSPLVAIHKGCNSIKKVRENLEMSMDMFKKSAENLIRLTYIKVNYPKQCFLNISSEARCNGNCRGNRRYVYRRQNHNSQIHLLGADKDS